VVTRSLNRLRLVGGLEGISYLLLLGVAMPLKYLAGMPAMVQVVGWIHGVLFILFVAAVADVRQRTQWSTTRVLGALVAALVPFGTFVLDTYLRQDLEAVIGRDPVTVAR
jgi:integral membrane protein